MSALGFFFYDVNKKSRVFFLLVADRTIFIMTNSKLKYIQITKNPESILSICRIFHYINVLSKRSAFKMSIPKTVIDLILVQEFRQNNEKSETIF